MGNRSYFGTDGIRGTVGQYPVVPEFIAKLGWAVGKALTREHGARVVIGKDTRISGYMLESALASGLNAAGVDVLYLGPMPTPGVAYLTRTFHADLGVVISASHNPYYDNGIKFFSSEGMKLPDQVEVEIESLLKQEMQVVPAERIGQATRVDDASGRYIEFCKASVPRFMVFSGLKIVLDCSHGAAYKIAPRVFQELGAEVVSIGVEPNGININDQIGSTHPEKLRALVQERKADIGIAFDGDADRVIMIDHVGNIVDGDEILYIIAKRAKANGLLNGGGVVGTQMSNLGFEQALERQGIPLIRTKVGDRYVMEALAENNWLLGGENSGHIIWRDAQTTGDGIVSALQVVAIMQEEQKSLRDLLVDMTKCPQVMINVKLDQKLTAEQKAVLVDLSEQETQKLGDQGRVLIRPSGTEPLIRVMVEGHDRDMIQQLAEELSKQIKSEF